MMVIGGDHAMDVLHDKTRVLAVVVVKNSYMGALDISARNSDLDVRVA